MIQALNRLQAIAKSQQTALLDPKAALAFVNGLLKSNKLDGVAKAKFGKTVSGDKTVIEIRGKVFSAGDLWMELYLVDDEKGKKTVEIYIADLPELEFDGNYFAADTDLKKANAAKKIVNTLAKGADAAKAFSGKLLQYQAFMINLSSFVEDLARNIER